MSQNFADLILGADTTGLLKGKKALEDTTKAGTATEKSVGGTEKGFKKAGDSAGRAAPQVEKFNKATGAAHAAALKATKAVIGMAAGYAAFAASSASLGKFISATVESDKAQAQLAAAITSTGGAAGKAVGDLNNHAAALQGITNYGDEVTNAMQGVLLTFTAVKGDTFNAATTAVLDLATAMGTDLNSAALQVGKALNDPILGMTALSRSGIQFTEAQKEAVKAMVATSDVAGAQAVILAELTKQFGGSAEAARDTLGGALAALGNAWGDLFEIAGPASEKLRASIENLIGTVTDPKFVQALQNIGALLFGIAGGALEVVAGLGLLVGSISGAVSAVSGFVRDVMGLTTANEIAQRVIDNGTLAMGDQITQIQILTRSTKEGSIISEEAARVRRAEAESLLQVLDATRLLNQQDFNQKSGLNEALIDVQRLTEELETLRTVKARAAEQGLNLPGITADTASWNAELENAENLLAQAQIKVEAIKQVQRELTFLTDDEVGRRQELVDLVSMLDRGIVNVKDGQVFLNGELVEGVDLSGRLSRTIGGIDFSAARTGAALLAADLNVNIEKAMALMGFLNTTAGIQASVSKPRLGFGGLGPADPDAADRAAVSFGNLGNSAESATARINQINAANAALSKTLTATTSGAGKAAGEAANEFGNMADEIERLEFDADPLKKYNAEIANLDQLVGAGLSDGAYQKAVKDLNEEFANSNPTISAFGDAIGDFVASGMRNFGDLLDSFKNMIKQMIATAIANPIKLALSAALGGGGTAAAAGQLGGASSGGGILGGLTAGAGNFIGTLGGAGGLLGGASSVFSGLMSGGLGGAASAIGSAVTGIGSAATMLGGLGAAIGAVALPIAAVAAVFSFFKTKTKQLDAGIRITVDGMDALIQSFNTVEKKKFWGLSKKVRTSFSDLDAATAGPLERIISQMQMGVMGASEALGIGASAFNDFSASIQVSTKGLSDEAAQKAVTEALQGFGDDFAGMIPGLEALQREGEGAYAALTRLSSSLNAANTIIDTLGGTLYDMSLAGAAMASSLVDAFGGLDRFNAATTAYYQAFYTEQERVEITTRQLTTAMSALGLALPKTRGELRAMIEAQDLATEGGRQMFAALVSLSSEFNAILPAIDSLANKLGALVAGAVDAALGPINSQIEASNAAAAQARQSADGFFRLADSLRTAAGNIGGVRNAADLASAGRDFAANFAKAVSGDVTALGSLGGSGQSLATDSAGFASTAAELRRIEAGISRQLNEAAAVSEALGLGANYQALLFDVQTAALEHLRDLLMSGNVTQELLQEQIYVLGNIGNIIQDSANLQVVAGRTDAGAIRAGLVDNSGRVVAGLSAEGARYIAGLEGQTAGLAAAIDANGDGLISAMEAQTSATLSTYQSTVSALASAIDRNGQMTTAQIRASLAGKASDAAITAVINAVDRNKDGIITAEESQAAKIIANATQRTTSELQAIYGQGLTFTNAITGQTASITGTQDLTNDELNKVQSLQGQTVSITELVERAVEGNATLTEALLSRLTRGIAVAGIGDMVNGLNGISNLLGRIVSAQETQLAAARAEAARQKALSQAQAALESTFQTQQTVISQVSDAAAAIYGLASQFPGMWLNAEPGPYNPTNTATFGVNEKGLYEYQYRQQSWSGQTGKANAYAFKDQYYSAGGLFDQTLGRSGELSDLAAQLEAQRQDIRDLGGVPSFDGGGFTGSGSRSGGMDGKGGFLSMLHPNETVIDHSQRKMSRGNSGSMDAKALREEVAELRRVMVEVVKYVKRTSEVSRKWDIDGAPAVRT